MHARVIFDESSLEAPPSPPLPAAPDEAAMPITYGSAFTHVTTVPSKGVSSSDFTPSLPKGPLQSIHPSARGPGLTASGLEEEINNSVADVSDSTSTPERTRERKPLGLEQAEPPSTPAANRDVVPTSNSLQVAETPAAVSYTKSSAVDNREASGDEPSTTKLESVQH